MPTSNDEWPDAHDSARQSLASSLDAVPGTASHRPVVLRALLWITVFGAAFFACRNGWHGLYPIALVEALFGVYALLLLWLTDIRHDPGRWALGYVIPLCAAILFACTQVRIDDSIYVWTLVVPIVAYILLGRRLGTIVTALFLIAVVAIFVYGLATEARSLSVSGTINIAVCQICVTGLTHIYETTRARAEAQLRYSALRDSLTGAYNRSGLRQHYSRHQPTTKPLALLVLDLDHFKQINDNFGHDAGDMVLQGVTRRIQSCLPDSAELYRLGGEEFGVLLPAHEPAAARRVAENMRYFIAATPYGYGETAIAVTATLGVAQKRPREALDELMARAYALLYRGKLNDRNQVVAL